MGAYNNLFGTTAINRMSPHHGHNHGFGLEDIGKTLLASMIVEGASSLIGRTFGVDTRYNMNGIHGGRYGSGGGYGYGDPYRSNLYSPYEVNSLINRPGIGRYGGRENYYGQPEYYNDQRPVYSARNSGYGYQRGDFQYPSRQTGYSQIEEDRYPTSRYSDERQDLPQTEYSGGERRGAAIDSDLLVISDDYTFDLDGNEIEPNSHQRGSSPSGNRNRDKSSSIDTPLFPNVAGIRDEFAMVAKGDRQFIEGCALSQNQKIGNDDRAPSRGFESWQPTAP